MRFVLLCTDEGATKDSGNLYADTTDAKNAEVIGSIAILLVAAEIAFVLLLDANHLQKACNMFKNRNCRNCGSKNKKRKEHTKRTATVSAVSGAAPEPPAPPPQPMLLHVPAPEVHGLRSQSPSDVRPRLNSTTSVTSFRSTDYIRRHSARPSLSNHGGKNHVAQEEDISIV